MNFFKAIFILTLLSSTILAQTIKKIEFNNLYFLSTQSANEIVDIELNQEYDDDKINLSIKKLFEQEYFRDISVNFNNGVLVYNFKEKPAIAKIDINGYKNNQEEIDEFIQTLGLKKGDIYDIKKIDRVKEKFLDALNMDGKLDSVVEVEVEELNENSVELIFVVNQGDSITIEELNLSGNSKISKEEIKNILVNKDKDDYIGWLWGFNDGEVHLEQLEYDSARVKDYYLSNGYLDADIQAPLLSVDFNDYSASLDINITEGQQYSVKNIDIEYIDNEVIDTKTLNEYLTLENNNIFNVANLRKDMQKLKTLVANKGYAFAKVYPDVKPNKEDSTVDITYKINSGDKVFINDVIISGNSATIDRIIRREIFLAPGDLYSLTDMTDSKNALQRTGYFETTSIKEKRVSSDKIDLIVEVKEAPTGNIMVGGGYGSYDGFMVNASISDRNIFGSGINTSLSIDRSQRSQRYNISIFNPRINDSTYSMGLNVYWNNYDSYEDVTYANESKGATISIGKIINRYIKSSISLNYVRTLITDYSIYATSTSDDDYTKGSISPSLTFNNTDDFYVPRRGVYATTMLEYAGIGGDVDFIKSYSSFSTFYGLKDYIDYDLVFRAKLRYGVIKSLGYTPTSERYYLGGMRSVRGYNYSSIRPYTYYTKDDGETIIILGGLQSLSGSLEASIPLIESARMRLTFFYDRGMIGNSKLTDMSMAEGYGAVIEWFAPIGPVNFVFSRALTQEYIDKGYESRFEFTIGQRF